MGAGASSASGHVPPEVIATIAAASSDQLLSVFEELPPEVVSNIEAARSRSAAEKAAAKQTAADKLGADFKQGDTVAVEGREGVVIMDLRPHGHEYCKLQWLDNGEESVVIEVSAVKAIPEKAAAKKAAEEKATAEKKATEEKAAAEKAVCLEQQAASAEALPELWLAAQTQDVGGFIQLYRQEAAAGANIKHLHTAMARMLETAVDVNTAWVLEPLLAESRTLDIPATVLQPGQKALDTRNKKLKGMGLKYSGKDSISNALNSGGTLLVKGSWLAEFATKGDKLPRRQDLPPGAGWDDVKELMLRMSEWAAWSEGRLGELVHKSPVVLVAVSYCWERKDHPDPRREQLKLLARLAILRIKYRRQNPCDDLAIFLDFPSLYQVKRSPAEQESFGMGLGAVNLWYGHNLIEKWLQTSKPNGAPKEMLPYMERGWPRFERSICELLANSRFVLDIGRLAEHIDGIDDYNVVQDKCEVVERSLPTLPSQFAKILETLTFTNGSDRDFVMKKYAATVEELICTSHVLDFGFRGWSAEEVFTFITEFLVRASCVTELRLGDNALDLRASQALSNLEAVAQLKVLGLRSCGLTSKELKPLLETTWPQLRTIELDINQLIDGDAMLVASKMQLQMPKLTSLDIERNKLTEAGKSELRKLWLDSGKMDSDLCTE